MFRRRIYGGMPIAPSESVGNSIIYVQAPWHKDLSPYNRSIYRETQFLDAKVQGLWAFHSSYAYGGLVFNDGNEMKPERQNDFAMELKFLLTTKDLDPNETYFILSGNYGYNICGFRFGVRLSDDNARVNPYDFTDRNIQLPIGVWTHYMLTWKQGVGRVYVNGEFVEQNSVAYFSDFYPSTYNVGGTNQFEVLMFPGYIRYVKVWNYAKNFDLDKFVPDP